MGYMEFIKNGLIISLIIFIPVMILKFAIESYWSRFDENPVQLIKSLFHSKTSKD